MPICDAGEHWPKKMADGIADVGFKNRGPKYRNDLWFLNQTDNAIDPDRGLLRGQFGRCLTI